MRMAYIQIFKNAHGWNVQIYQLFNAHLFRCESWAESPNGGLKVDDETRTQGVVMGIKLNKLAERGCAVTARGARRELTKYSVTVDGQIVATIEGYLGYYGQTMWALWAKDGKPYGQWKFSKRADAVAEVKKRYEA